MFRFVVILITCVVFEADLAKGIECFQCAYIASDPTSNIECTNYNTTTISNCGNSTACMQLAYENPETEEYVSFFLDCGTTECTEGDKDGVEAVDYNTNFNNYTRRKVCHTEEYGNCKSPVCTEAKEAHLAALQADATDAPTNSTTAAAQVDCFQCSHIPQIGAVSPSCLEDNTSQTLQCPGTTCMKLAQQYNNGSTEYILYTLDCGYEKCNESVADGVERSTVVPGSDPIVERLTCCAGEFCNCKSATCLESIGVTAPPSMLEETTYIQEETTAVQNILETSVITSKTPEATTSVQPIDQTSAAAVKTETTTKTKSATAYIEATTEPFVFETQAEQTTDQGELEFATTETETTYMEATTEPFVFETTAEQTTDQGESEFATTATETTYIEATTEPFVFETTAEETTDQGEFETTPKLPVQTTVAITITDVADGKPSLISTTKAAATEPGSVALHEYSLFCTLLMVITAIWLSP